MALALDGTFSASYQILQVDEPNFICEPAVKVQRDCFQNKVEQRSNDRLSQLELVYRVDHEEVLPVREPNAADYEHPSERRRKLEYFFQCKLDEHQRLLVFVLLHVVVNV